MTRESPVWFGRGITDFNSVTVAGFVAKTIEVMLAMKGGKGRAGPLAEHQAATL
jgi:hypothetical protein